MDPITQQTVLAAAGAGGDPVYVDDVFSTFLYEGTGAAQTITNGIDLAGEGGWVWAKSRSSVSDSRTVDSDSNSMLSTSLPNSKLNGSNPASNYISFNSDGFSLGINGPNQLNDSYVAWSWRKAPGFFDVVTYTGTGSTQNISHSLGSVPGMIIVKNTTTATNWETYHRSTGATKKLELNENSAAATNSGPWNDTEPTSSVFTVGTNNSASGATYVAYIFAHDDASFGTDSDEAIIKCGDYTGNATSGRLIDLGFEPQWVLIKKSSGAENWFIFDVMRGLIVGTGEAELFANSSSAETGGNNRIDPDPVGFRLNDLNDNYQTYIYMAIRRPHKPPTVGTEVFDVIARSGTGSTTVVNGNIEPVDLVITKSKNTTNAPVVLTRMLGNYGLETHTTTAATTNVLGTSINPWDIQDGIRFTGDGDTNASGGFNYINYFFKRASGFFDIVAWSGNAVSNRAITHNLGVIPELLITKRRSGGDGWWTQYTGIFGTNNGVRLDANGVYTGVSAFIGTSVPTSSVFHVGSDSAINGSGDNYIAYLFATLPGISKVGSYTGNGSTQNIDCGFTTGARFVLIKRTDGASSWYLFDSAQGITSGNDPYLTLNSTNGQITTQDKIDPHPSSIGFALEGDGDVNSNGESYIFLAIA